MKKILSLLAVLLLLHCSNADPLDEDYGYVDVRDGAHMFWVTYHTELPGDWSTHPLILWLQGGPGSSGVGYGNFWELGPYDINGNLREGRWTKKGNLMFIDNPVGTGYSYVDSPDLYCTDNSQIADDLVTLLTSVFTDYPDMQNMPFYIFAESYGGKMTADFAIALDAAITRGDIACNFQGIATGDSWISPMDSVNTWGSYLYWMGMVNKDGQAQVDAAAARTQNAVDAGNWAEATAQWSIAEGVVEAVTYGVDFYNVLVEDSNSYFLSEADNKKYSYLQPELRKSFIRHVKPYSNKVGDALDDFMNGPQKDSWNIPADVSWGGQSGEVFDYLRGDFMKPVVESMAYLLNNSNIHVTVYTGDLDLICDTPGTYLWIENMNYNQKTGYEATRREALYVASYPNVAAYNQRYERFSLFTILRSGHMVPLDAPEMSLNMIDIIIGYSNETDSAAKKKLDLVKGKQEITKKLLHEMKVNHPKASVQELKEKHAEAKQSIHEKAEVVHEKEQEIHKNKVQNIKHTEIKKENANHEHELKHLKQRHNNVHQVHEEAVKNIKNHHEENKGKPNHEEVSKKEKVQLVKEAVEEIKEAHEEKEKSEAKEKMQKVVEEIKEAHEEKEKSETKEKIQKVVETIQNEDKDDKEKALKKLRLKKKLLAYKAAEKANEKPLHPNSLHDKPQQSKHDKEVADKLKAIFQNKILNSKPEEQKH